MLLAFELLAARLLISQLKVIAFEFSSETICPGVLSGSSETLTFKSFMQ